MKIQNDLKCPTSCFISPNMPSSQMRPWDIVFPTFAFLNLKRGAPAISIQYLRLVQKVAKSKTTSDLEFFIVYLRPLRFLIKSPRSCFHEQQTMVAAPMFERKSLAMIDLLHLFLRLADTAVNGSPFLYKPSHLLACFKFSYPIFELTN